MRMLFSRSSLLAASALAVLGAQACSGADRKDDKPGFVALEVDGDSEIEKLDLNEDGKPEVFRYYNRLGSPETPREQRERVLARKDSDLNRDGKIDMREHYTRQGQIARIDIDLDFDQKFDATHFFRDGEDFPFRVEYVTDFSGQTAIWKFYKAKDLVERKELDTTGNGKPDVFEYYDDKGTLLRVGYDRDGDGKPDYYEEAGDKKG